MFSKDPVKRKKQIEYALKYNNKLSEKGRETLLKMQKELGTKTSKKSSKPKSTKKAAKPVNQYGVKKGDIFYDSYGYDATYYDFFEVTDILGKSKVKVRKLEKNPGKGKSYGYNDWTVRPGAPKGEEMERIVKKMNFYPEGDKRNLYIGGSFKGTHARHIDREEAFNRDWHEDDYH